MRQQCFPCVPRLQNCLFFDDCFFVRDENLKSVTHTVCTCQDREKFSLGCPSGSFYIISLDSASPLRDSTIAGAEYLMKPHQSTKHLSNYFTAYTVIIEKKGGSPNEVQRPLEKCHQVKHCCHHLFFSCWPVLSSQHYMPTSFKQLFILTSSPNSQSFLKFIFVDCLQQKALMFHVL